ncbi:tyrosine-protein phosphatase [Mariprofundus ferrooxydans]|uniref:tyrosine-protein phosphatase n=1 Tax=Mariprofundus ferrooxydans TaxID=314344 RepID=UPI00037DDE51|nr:CpsB/CapC family capsule biosynthesis tyrosine phosphatase [Mariprofundus ferrooxydans]
MLDLHCHLLPGIDDGARTLDESLALARHAVEHGISRAVMTPHIQPGVYDNSAENICDAVQLLRAHLADHDIPLRIAAGAEVRICPELIQMIPMGQIPFLGESEGYKVLLLEFPHSHILPGSEQLVRWLLNNNIRPLIAHPERNKGLHADPHRIAPFVSMGCMLQVTAGSVSGSFGTASKAVAHYLLEQGWVDVLATDAHNLNHRPPELKAGMDDTARLVGEAKAHALVYENSYVIAGYRFDD